MQDHTNEIGRFGSNDALDPRPESYSHAAEIAAILARHDLDRALLGRARVHVLVDSSTNRSTGFECPDCEGSPACRTCGEPTRPAVLDHLQRALRRRLAS